MPRNARDQTQVDAAAREQLLAERDQHARDAVQFSTPEGRRWAYELMVLAPAGPPPGLKNRQLREMVGEQRPASRLFARLWQHPELAQLAMTEHAKRAKAKQDALEAMEKAAEDTRRKHRDASRGEDFDVAPS